MENTSNKRYDLDERTLEFGKRVIRLVKALPKNSVNFNLGDQVVRSGTSMGANYREANETLTKKDFYFKIGICRKEAKETVYWLNLIIEANQDLKQRILPLLEEGGRIVKDICGNSTKI